jgi:hypothetical protein
MTRDALKHFAAMFATDPGSLSESAWYKRFPMYAHDADAGAQPWWPPLSEVWYVGETCPYRDGSAAEASWPEAWALLQRLHGEYVEAKAGR